MKRQTLSEVPSDPKARRLHEIMRSREFLQLKQQRDALMIEVHELNQHIETMKNKHTSEVNQLNKEVKSLRTHLDEQRVETEQEKGLKEVLEKQIEELNIELNKEKNARLAMPTLKETELEAELQGAREALRLTEEEVAAAKEERRKFLETFAKITDSENNKMGIQQKLAMELLYKEETITQQQNQLKELSRSKKIFEQKCSQYETNIRKIFSFNKKTCTSTDYIKQEEQIIGLQIKLLEAMNRNEELNDQLVQKQHELDEQEKTARAQQTVIKVREELINRLKIKETELTRDISLIQSDLNAKIKKLDEECRKLSAARAAITELTTRAECKQIQMVRLEKVILAQEHQQRRAQEQRTRHEEMIAELEHQLCIANRNKKKFFLF